MQAAAIYAQDSLSGNANIVGTALAVGRSLDDVEVPPGLARIGAAGHRRLQIEMAARKGHC